MNAYRFNQIAMAVLGALLLVFGTRTIMKIAFEEHEPEQASHAKKPEAKPAGEAGGGDNILALIATASPEKGADVAKKCQLCHNFDKGGPNLIGPNLYGVLDRKIASHEGYDYSDALKGKEGVWDYLNIDHMIEHPNVFAPGTKMALFQGLPEAKDRAAVIAFLRTKTDNPPPLPEAKAVEAAPAGAEPPAGAPAAGGEDIVAILAKGDAKRGADVAKKCQICHSFDKGGPNMIGPNLYGVLGRKVASHEGYDYSDALKAKSADTWDYASINDMIEHPNVHAPGTKMALFQGLADAKQRGDVILFLRTKTDNPPPLPEAAGAPAAAPAAADKPAEAPAAPASEQKPAEAAPAAPAPDAKPAEPASPPAEEEKPAQDTPAAPAPEPAPAEEKPAEAPGAEMAPSYKAGEDSKEQPSSSQPQPTYPDGAPQ